MAEQAPLGGRHRSREREREGAESFAAVLLETRETELRTEIHQQVLRSIEEQDRRNQDHNKALEST